MYNNDILVLYYGYITRIGGYADTRPDELVFLTTWLNEYIIR